jgi:fatty-acyl-CoA synthase
VDLAAAIGIARSQSLGDLPRRSARRFPDKIAIVDGDVRLSFAGFEDAVGRTAAALAAAGLAAGDRLAILSHNCWQFAVLSFATARAGVILVPVNFMLGAQEIAFVLQHCEASAFVVEDALVPTAQMAIALVGESPRLRRQISLTDAAPSWPDVADWIDFADSAPDRLVHDDDPIRLMYTSGTESRPKGALLSSRSLLWEYASCIIDGGMSPDDVELHSLPLYHCAQLDCFLGPDVMLGATSVIARGPDPSTLLRLFETERITKFFAPPTVWISLLRASGFDAVDLSSLRKGYYGASPMPVEVLREMQTRLPDVRLWNFYGQTEMAPLATILGPDEQMTHAGSAGRAGLNVETRVVDEHDQPVPVGTIGEIVHRSPHATLGYYKQDDQSADAFRNGWFHSGDLGVLDSAGYLNVVDRKKDVIKSGGENVASREVEEMIYTLDGVAEVAVFGIPDPRWVETVVAAVVARPGRALEADDVIAHCRDRLAGFKTPKHVVIVDSLPKNPSGKLLKRDLRDRYGDLSTR